MMSNVSYPAWFQTRWFYALFMLLIVAVVVMLYRLRLARARADTRRLLEVRLSERARIARDLHDTLLQGIQGLMFRLQAVRQLLPERPGDAAEFLDSAMQVGDLAIGEGRNAVRRLHTSSIDHRDIAASLGALGTELAAGIDPRSRPHYRVIVEGRPCELAVVVRDDAYRIAREAVRNAYDHAEARRIETEVIFGRADLTIRVRDDGIGVDPQILACGQRAGHWGLPGMRERSESFGGRLHIRSVSKEGTEVELRVPARVAYAQPVGGHGGLA
jgi:signal transduction histidine kinase